MFDGLYEVISKSESEATIKLSDKKHPIFKAHFPMHPILPGFTHFEIVADVFDIEIVSIKKAKFMALVTPKQILKYEKNANKFRVFCEDEEVASFSL
jgi:3-hydroxyacyl-[acyl-carrier-protein] dehydratase